jgi:hypothetical protein
MEHKLSMTEQLLQQWTDPLSFGKRITDLERYIDCKMKVCVCADGHMMALSVNVAEFYTTLQIKGDSETHVRSVSHFRAPKILIWWKGDTAVFREDHYYDSKVVPLLIYVSTTQ